MAVSDNSRCETPRCNSVTRNISVPPPSVVARIETTIAVSETMTGKMSRSGFSRYCSEGNRSDRSKCPLCKTTVQHFANSSSWKMIDILSVERMRQTNTLSIEPSCLKCQSSQPICQEKSFRLQGSTSLASTANHPRERCSNARFGSERPCCKDHRKTKASRPKTRRRLFSTLFFAESRMKCPTPK